MSAGSDQPQLPDYHAPSETPPEYTEKTERPPFVVHPVQKGDTVAGVALKYGVSVYSVKHANKLHHDFVIPRNYLFIVDPKKDPGVVLPDPLAEQGAMISQFMQRAKCVDRQVALVYLDECKWDVDAAVKKYQADDLWEAQRQRSSSRR
ncbi:hypothetical protein MP638_003952 [Amoeboaphelidium occidentale]|nr:hypothetical protein MP638_003952 [Amoeboaphelidium occidentale]